ncbi:MAG: F0F1 ATP synthase subunit A [Candidatus Gottesmanbacteria bacterium]
MNISIAAEPVFYFMGFPVTNSLIGTWIVMAVLITLALAINKVNKIIPQGLQNYFEAVFGGFLGLAESIAGEKARIFFPIIFTFFIFIILSNWFGLLPGVGSLGFYEEIHGHRVFIPYFRAATSDLNTTIALAIISVAATQYFGFKSLKIKYMKRFFDFSGPINFFVGILELVSEFTKIISFGFRLFGNIFAGEVLLMVMAFLIPLAGSLPFFGLEIFIGFIQALVFSMLSLVFFNVATIGHEEH